VSRALVSVAVLAAAGVVAATPGLRSPVARLANYHADPRGPQYDVPVDDAALRRAGALLPNSASTTYFVAAPPSEPVLYGNVHASLRLYSLPALPVRRPAAADWILAYGTAPPVPLGRVRLHTYRLGPGIVLVEVGT
jgi:hypothetical protein